MATKKYLDQAGLKTLIQGLKAKNDALYAAKGHAHTPDQLVYVNAHMSSAATVKDALDILAANVVRNAEQMTTATNNMEDIQDEVDALKTQVGEGGVDTKINAVKDALDAFKKAQATKDGEQDTAIAAAKKAGDDAQADVDALELKVGTVPADKTVIGLIGEAQAAADAAQEAADDAQADATSALTQIAQEVKDRQAADTALGGRIDGVVQSVADEKTRAEAKENALQTAIDAINNADSGILAQAKEYADGKDAAIKAAKDAADAAQADVDALAGKVGTVEEGKTVVGLIGEAKAQADKGVADAAAEADRAKGVEQGLRADLGNKEDAAAADGSAFARIAKVKADLEAEVTRADTAEKKAQAQADANKAAIETLNGDVNVDGSVDKKIKTAIDKVNTDASALAGRVTANENAIAVINGVGEGSIKKAVADLVNGAPEAMDTLKELADSITTHQSAYDAYVAQVAKDIAAAEKAAKDYADDQDETLHTTITGEIATAKSEAISAAAEKDTALENKLQANIDDKVDQTAYDAKVAALEKADTDNLAAAKKYADDEDAKIEAVIGTADDLATADTLYGKIKALQEKDAAQDTEIGKKAAATDLDALETLVGEAGDEAEANTVFGKIKAEAARAKGAEEALGGRIDALVSGDKSVDAKIKAAVGDVDLAKGETVSSYVTEAIGDAKTELQGNIDTNADAIEVLNGNAQVPGSVDAKIEAARSALQTNIDTKVAQTVYNAKVTELEAADTALDGRLDVIEGNGEGSIAKALVDAKAYTDTQIDGMALTEAEINAILAEVYPAQ